MPKEPEIPTDAARLHLLKTRAEMFQADADLRQSAAAEAGQQSVKAAFLSNGGAILALLTMIGNSDSSFNKVGMWWAFLWFGLGFISSMLSHWTHYRSLGLLTIHARYCATQLSHPDFAFQFEERAGESERAGKRYRNLTFSLLCLSAVLFAIGSLVALEAIV